MPFILFSTYFLSSQGVSEKAVEDMREIERIGKRASNFDIMMRFL
jgi:hypothetical protein